MESVGGAFLTGEAETWEILLLNLLCVRSETLLNFILLFKARLALKM